MVNEDQGQSATVAEASAAAVGDNQAATSEPQAESAAQPDEAGNTQLSAEELLLTLQDAQAKADEYWNQLLRAKAEMANMQRRAERDLESAHKYGLEKFCKALLPIKDSLELGLAAADNTEADRVKVHEGIALTLSMFNDEMAKLGLVEINPVGEVFNPEYHQAMSAQPSAEVPANTVLTVYQKGYLLNDRLVRPAMVVVSTNSAPPGGNEQQKIDESA